MESRILNRQYKYRTVVSEVSFVETRLANHFIYRYGERLTPYYDSLCEAGMQEGVHCFGHDHVGHGESEGKRVQVNNKLIM